MNALTSQSWAARVVAVDASTYGGTVAVLRDGVVVCERTVAMRGEREERLMPAVAEALDECGIAPNTLTAVICGAGPGSFTSLRIAASIAKGLAHAAAAPLLAVPSLALLAFDGARGSGERRVLASLDAMRGESYVAIVTLGATGDVLGYESLGIVATPTLDAVATAHEATRARGDAVPHARGVASLALLLDEAGPVDLDAWEPDYGRKAEAQVKWEAAHGRELPVGETSANDVSA